VSADPHLPQTSSSSPTEEPATLIRHAVVLQLKLILEGLKDIVLGPIALVALAVDLLLRRSRDGRLFYQTLRGGERFEQFLNLYGALPERRDRESDDPPTDPTLDKFIEKAERRIQERSRTRRPPIDGPGDRG
jgi:hypothetical protein